VTEQDRAILRDTYVRTNRTGESGSAILAARLCAQSGKLSEEVSKAILKPRYGNEIPKVIRDAMTTAPAIIQRHRNAKDARLKGLYIPGNLRMVRDPETNELRRLEPGERQSWDDATINFGVCIPWPWGGDKCSDKYGVRVGRFQFLAALDDATDYLLGFDYVIRDAQSYRAEDVVAAQYRLWRNTYKPDRCMLEGGAWQANRSKAFHKAAGVDVEDATGRPNNKLIEGFFNRLWTPLSTMPGNVGRYRGEQRAESEIYIACRNGRKDPRQHFPMLNDALADMQSAIRYLNNKEVNSRRYGRWIPAEAHAEGLARHPRQQIAKDLFFHAAPVMEQRKVRRGMITLTCQSPFGESFQYHFAEENLWQYEGRKVRIYFDPWQADLSAEVLLDEAFAGIRQGTRICSAVCLEDAPQVEQSAAGIRVEIADRADIAMQIRKRQHQHIRREHRTMETEGRIQLWSSETRIENARTELSVSRVEKEPEAQPQTIQSQENEKAAREERERLQARIAAAEKFEAAARRRGELVTA
jgi:hypothetical protein